MEAKAASGYGLELKQLFNSAIAELTGLSGLQKRFLAEIALTMGNQKDRSPFIWARPDYIEISGKRAAYFERVVQACKKAGLHYSREGHRTPEDRLIIFVP
jgi:hypothetical protein